MKLFLSGGGKTAFELDEKFIELIDKSKPMLYIPIAMKGEHSYPECLEWIKKYFSKFNFDNIKMLTDLRKIKKQDLEKYGSVYIGGGNTPYLLKEIKESGFYEILEYLCKKDIPIAGGSAGAIIFAKSIIPSLSSDENKVKLKDFSALNKVDYFELWCHYDSSMDKQIFEFIKKYKLIKVIALPEYCGIYIDENKIQIFGKPESFVFDKNGKRKITKILMSKT